MHNLETADFEWFDVSPNPKFQDQDNLKVPNLNKVCKNADAPYIHAERLYGYCDR